MRRMLVTLCAAFALLLPGSGATSVQTRLDLTSQPAGASVTVDGRDRGITPVTLFDLAPGRHHVKMRLAGYVERDRMVTLEADVPLARNAVMEPEKGILILKSEPPGCGIFVDGASLGETPRLVTHLDAKDAHRITLRKAGYREQTFEVRFNGRTPVVRTERLIVDSGTVVVATDPPGASVTVNGVARGKTPVTVPRVAKGVATVRLALAGYREEKRELAMNAGETQNLSIALEPLPGTLDLVSVPEGARFYVNGEFRGKSPVSIPGLKPGSYTVRAELEGFGTETRTVAVGNGATPREEFRLANVKGSIDLRTQPAGAQVVFDGHVLGTTKSTDPDAEFSDVFQIRNVLEGEHALVVRKDGYAETVRHPVVKSSETKPLVVRLRRVFNPDVEIVTDTGTWAGELVSRTPEYVTIEVKLGVQRSFPVSDIRKINFLTGKASAP